MLLRSPFTLESARDDTHINHQDAAGERDHAMHEEMLAEQPVSCPYCGTAFELLIDGSQGSHSTWEDCPRCCAPIQISVEVAEPEGDVQAVTLARDDDVL